MLERALAPGMRPAQRSALDDRFYRVPEDLAVFTARRVGLRHRQSASVDSQNISATSSRRGASPCR